MESLWDQIVSSKYDLSDFKPREGIEEYIDVTSMAPNLLDNFTFLSFDSLNHHQVISKTDNTIPGKIKKSHKLGATARCKFVSNNEHNYTGVLKGCDNIIIRHSLATYGTDLNEETKDKNVFNTPTGLSLKFFDLNDDHEDLVLLSKNSFKYDDDFLFRTNILAANEVSDVNFDTSKTKWFENVAFNPGNILIDNLTLKDQYGKKELNPNHPKELILEPTNELISMYNDTNKYPEMLLNDISNVTIYNLKDENGKTLGSLILTHPFIRSKFGDEELFFHHNMEYNPNPFINEGFFLDIGS